MSNLSLLIAVAKGLGHLRESVVFVGGAVTELYGTVDCAGMVIVLEDGKIALSMKNRS